MFFVHLLHGFCPNLENGRLGDVVSKLKRCVRMTGWLFHR